MARPSTKGSNLPMISPEMVISVPGVGDWMAVEMAIASVGASERKTFSRGSCSVEVEVVWVVF